MNIGLIFAMECEKQAYLSLIDSVKCKHNLKTYVCGIGKVNASCTTTSAIINDKLDLVINCGIAGGINSAKALDVYYGTDLKYSDVDVTMFDYEIGQIPQMPATYKSLENSFSFTDVKNGKIASQDTFATDIQKEFLKKNYSDYSAIDMESCAIAQSCYNLNKDFIIIRSISDLIFEPDNHLNFKEKEDLACQKAAITLVELLNQI